MQWFKLDVTTGNIIDAMVGLCGEGGGSGVSGTAGGPTIVMVDGTIVLSFTGGASGALGGAAHGAGGVGGTRTTPTLVPFGASSPQVSGAASGIGGNDSTGGGYGGTGDFEGGFGGNGGPNYTTGLDGTCGYFHIAWFY
jgi:hypothetical protein